MTVSAVPQRATAVALPDWALLVIPGLIWGASFLFIAEGLHVVQPFGLTFLRILIGFSVLAGFPGVRRPIERRDWLSVAALGAIWMAVPLTFFPFAEQHVSSAVTGMLNGSNPIFTAIITTLVVRQMPSRGVVLGLAVGVLGTVLIALPSVGEGRSEAGGVALILAAMVCYACALNIAKPLQARYGGLPVIWRAQMVALVLTAPLGIPDVLRAQWSLWPTLAIVALGAFGTGIAYIVMVQATARLGPTRASATTFLIPGVALVLGMLVRHERVPMLSIAGSVVCVLGAWLMRRASTH
jgi:drug/metabolite transporter (DMT)-like permease